MEQKKSRHQEALGTRYFFSVIFDFILVLGILIPFTLPWFHEYYRFVPGIWFVLVSFHFVSDKLFGGASIGKRIFGIRLQSTSPSGEITFGNVAARRFHELVRYPFRRVRVDLNKISSTRLVYLKTFTPEKSEKPETMAEKKQVPSVPFLFHERLYAGLLDFAFVSPFVIGAQLIRISGFRTLIGINDIQYSLIGGFLFLIIFLYYLFKDRLNGNTSFGKRHYRLEIVDMEGKIPTGFQLSIRGFVQMMFFPIEIILFLLKKRLISDSLTYTKVAKLKKRYNR